MNHDDIRSLLQIVLRLLQPFGEATLGAVISGTLSWLVFCCIHGCTRLKDYINTDVILVACATENLFSEVFVSGIEFVHAPHEASLLELIKFILTGLGRLIEFIPVVSGALMRLDLLFNFVLSTIVFCEEDFPIYILAVG